MTRTIAEEIDSFTAAIDGIRRVFGAPGDHGYDTPEGQALYAQYKSYAEVGGFLISLSAAEEASHG